MYIQGSGLVNVNFLSGNTSNYWSEQINVYEDVIVDAAGNRIWVEGFGTDFINDPNDYYVNQIEPYANTQIVVVGDYALNRDNLKVLIKDIGNTGSYFYRDINIIVDANTLFLTSNTDVSIVNGEILYRN